MNPLIFLNVSAKKKKPQHGKLQFFYLISSQTHRIMIAVSNVCCLQEGTGTKIDDGDHCIQLKIHVEHLIATVRMNEQRRNLIRLIK